MAGAPPDKVGSAQQQQKSGTQKRFRVQIVELNNSSNLARSMFLIMSFECSVVAWEFLRSLCSEIAI